MEFESIAVGAFQANAWLVWDPHSLKGVLVDPGDEPARLLSWIAAKGVRVEALLATHGHLDHVSAAEDLSRELGGLPLLLHPGDRFLLEVLPETRKQFGLPPAEPPSLVEDLAEGDRIPLGGEFLEVRHVPGHSPGSAAFLGGGAVLTGDLLFKGSVGRTDLPGGDGPLLFRSIREKILTLPGETRILPGHGPVSTVAEEIRSNPFLLGILEG